MIYWLLTSILCFWLFRRFTSKLEVREDGRWVKFTSPVWQWTLIALIALTPGINFILLLLFEYIVCDDTLCTYPDFRFKEGKSSWMVKFLKFMTKKL